MDLTTFVFEEIFRRLHKTIKYESNIENVKDFILSQKSVYNCEFGAEGVVIRYRKDTLPYRRWMAKIRKKDFKVN